MNRTVNLAIALFLIVVSFPLCVFPEDMEHSMSGMYGPYPMAREASGTSWQPEARPPAGIDWMSHDWMFMLHGWANAGYDSQGGPRGGTQWFTTNMLMFMGQRTFGDDTVGFRTMTTLEPLMGSNGYPELLQTGETADGVNPLIDRQHPHDALMELALTESHELTPNSSVFLYGGLPGEPALGPTAFMHRLSAEDNPFAPIGHHWMDSTHITYGVLTAGYVWEDFKLEGSSFRGREPSQNHWPLEESPKLDSYSGRLSYNPTTNWSSQVSWGHLTSPEQLFPNNNTNRATASVSYTLPWRDGWSASTLGWGRNWQENLDTLDAALLESSLNIHHVHTVFTRFEYVQKDDLVPDIPLMTPGAGFFRDVDYHPYRPFGNTAPFTLNIFGVKQLTLGYIYDFAVGHYVTWGIGASGMMSFVPSALKPYYGNLPLSYAVFVRAKLGRGTATEARTANIPTSVPASSQAISTPTSITPVPAMSHDQLSRLFNTSKPGTMIQVFLKNKKTFMGPFSGYDTVNDTVWFLNPPNAFFKTRGIRMDAIVGAAGVLK